MMSSWLRKGFSQLLQNGPSFVLRAAIYNFCYHRYERLRNRWANNGAPRARVCSLWREEFELHPSLKGISEDLLLLGAHEPLATSVYLEHLRPGDHVVDVGPNIGYWLFLARKGIGESGRIIGFEPAPRVYEVLERNIGRMKQRGDIQIFRYALGASNETAYFYESEVPNWGSLIRSENLSVTRQTAVKVRRLDDVVQAIPRFRPTVLRMDVEGGELMVLAGARQILRAYRPLLFVEFHRFALRWEEIRDAFLDLKDIGYRRGVLIDRIWDHAWIPRLIRNQRCWRGTIDDLLARINFTREPLKVFSVILEASETPRVCAVP